ncbi:hypothetical protein ACIQVA_39175 [Streptomyces microflavus]|uniref:hypothetical protein n=1 Tax=Streptomyces microflavus TaxID=1919 RepID=UPI003829243E
MTERLAVTVHSLPELRRMLRAFAETGDGMAVPGLHRGSAGHDRGAAAEIWADDDLRELLAERWGREGKHRTSWPRSGPTGWTWTGGHSPGRCRHPA